MPRPTPTKFEDSITVTTATRSEDEVRASLGVEKPAAEAVETPAGEETPPEKVAKTAGEEVEADPVIAQEADSAKTDQEVSDAARTLRQSRLGKKTSRLDADIALYEDNVKRLGGKPKAFEKRAYANGQAEIDHKTRHRHELLEQFNTILKTPPAKPAASAPPPPAPPVARTDGKAPEFKYPTWEQYQVEHPEAEYTEYVDARSDAREAFKRQITTSEEQITARKTWEADAVKTFTTSVESFKADHADYDDATKVIELEKLGFDPDRISFFRHLVLRDGANAPASLYFLAQPANREYLDRMLQVSNPADFSALWGEIRYAARVSFATPPASREAAKPTEAEAKPRTSAPAPLSAPQGSATHTRSLQTIAEEDGEDADSYIAERNRTNPATRRR